MRIADLAKELKIIEKYIREARITDPVTDPVNRSSQSVADIIKEC